MMGKRVHSNDYLLFNHYISKALIENSTDVLTEEEVDELIQFTPGVDNFIEREFSGIYFDKNAPEMLAMLEHVLANWFPPEIETGIGPVSNSEEINKLVSLIKKVKGE